MSVHDQILNGRRCTHCQRMSSSSVNSSSMIPARSRSAKRQNIHHQNGTCFLSFTRLSPQVNPMIQKLCCLCYVFLVWRVFTQRIFLMTMLAGIHLQRSTKSMPLTNHLWISSGHFVSPICPSFSRSRPLFRKHLSTTQ